jgi:colanic acid biosynthesis glycosyl transferase WcaI
MIRNSDSGRQERIIFATRHYAPELIGSAPVAQVIAEWLALHEGYHVEVVTVRPSYPEPFILPGFESGQHDRAVENGVHVRRFATCAVAPGGMSRRIGPELLFLWNLVCARLNGSLRPSPIVISLCPSILAITGALALKRRHGLHIAIVHDIASGLGAALGLGRTALLVRALRGVETWTLNRADKVVVLSRTMERILRENGVTAPVVVLPPQIDTDQIQPMASPRGQPPTVMYSGGLSRRQGVGQLTAMAAVLKRVAPEVRVLIRGEGVMKDALRRQIEVERLTNVVLAPLVPSHEISRSLAEGDVHLVPQLSSAGEFSVPSKAFAIMAAGRPFIATAPHDSPLAALCAANGVCVCVPPDNVEALVDAALELLKDEPRRRLMGEAGRRYIERNASKGAIMENFSELIAWRSIREHRA